MKPLLFVVVAACIAGCSHGQVQINAGAVNTVSGGTAVNSSSAGLGVQSSGGGAAALIGLGFAAAVVYGAEATNHGMHYRSNPFMAITGTARAPELSPGRKVNEQDCTRPIADFSSNLKCR